MDYKRLTKKDYRETKSLPLNYGELITRLWILENKIENGTLIELPCKVGSTVWKVEREYNYNNDTYFWHIVEKPFVLGMLDYWWGRTIFLTKAEAEAMLLQLKGDKE